jgi:hypothetical protein
MIFVTGERATLDALKFTLSRGSCISRLANMEDEDDLDIYAPLLTPINHAYKIHHLQGYPAQRCLSGPWKAKWC